MSTFKTIGLIVLVFVLIIANSSLFIITEGQAGLKLRLGEIVKDSDGKDKVYGPGLHFKVPFLNQVRKFDVRLQTLTVQSSRIMTEEQKYVIVDYYVKWRIEEVALFYKRTNGMVIRAQTLLEQQINDALRAAFGKRTITDVISGERMNIMSIIAEATNKSAQDLGVEVIDMRIKSVDLPKEVSESVFARMRVKREQVANHLRSDGKAQAEKIRAKADAIVTVTIAKAQEEGAIIRAKGLAEAADIYAQAYQKDSEFYEFYRSLEAYTSAFDQGQDMLVLQPEAKFFKYFNNINGNECGN